MAKQQKSLRYIFKIRSTRLAMNNWNFNLTIQEAKLNDELISIADSNGLKFVDEISNNIISEDKINNIKKEINLLKKLSYSPENKKKITHLYKEKEDLLFVKDIVFIVFDKLSHFDRAISKKGLYINGVRFKRLLGTPGGIKKSTLIFASENIYENLCKRIDNGREATKKFIPAKLEAYKSLVFSSSSSVTFPKGILVVDDCVTKFNEDIIEINDSDDNKPTIIHKPNEQITLEASDGFGLMTPEFAQRWSEDLKLDYVSSAFVIRNAFCKGVLVPFDIVKFAQKIVSKDRENYYIVKDVWGQEHDIRDIDIILTKSMLKLWESYSSIEHYIDCCKQNNYDFRVSKTSPKQLDNVRYSNYQYLQSISMTDEEIDELIAPTVNEIKDVLGGDYRKALIFLNGKCMTPESASFDNQLLSYFKALMIDGRIINDPFIREKILLMIKKKIQEAKIGVLKLNGNFSIIIGDPFGLAQSIFGLTPTGLLSKRQAYSKHWIDKSIIKVTCFRSPMSCHNNIRRMEIVNNADLSEWYEHINTCFILNNWDSVRHAMNGADCDGDIFFTTDNKQIYNNVKDLPTLMCVQKTSEKIVPNDKDLAKSNRNGFGDKIGQVTNRITSMYDLIINYNENSKEYKELSYRIMCGQHYQQCEIDKMKGIISNPMPKEWYNYKKAKESNNELDIKIVADKKPYFFTYIYPHIMSKHKTHFNNYDNQCIRMFGLDFKQLYIKTNLSHEEESFIDNYKKYSYTTDNNSIMNRICHRIESILGNIKDNIKSDEFDVNIIKSGVSYDKSIEIKIKNLKSDYNKSLRSLYRITKRIHTNNDEYKNQKHLLNEHFKQEAYNICNNKYELCDIFIDLFYTSSKLKEFVWNMVGDVIIENLLRNNNNQIKFPVYSPNGDIEYDGDYFSEYITNIEKEDD